MRTLLFVLIAFASAPGLAADPIIHVRGKLRIDVDTIERSEDGLTIRGRVRDDASDEPVAGARLALALDGDGGAYGFAQPTLADGSFRWLVKVPLGRYHLRISAPGSRDYDAAPTADRALDVARATPTLTLQLPERHADGSALHVVVEAFIVEAPAPPRAFIGAVEIEAAGARQAVHVVDGRGELDLRGPLGSPGRRVSVTARIAADTLYNAAETTRTVLLTAPSSLSLRAGPSVAPDEALAVDGELDTAGGPIAEAEVRIGLEGGRVLASTLTDARGRFHARLDGRPIAAGAKNGIAFLEASYAPRQEWRDPAVSPTVPLSVRAAAPPPSWPYLVSPLGTLAGVLVIVALRRRGFIAFFVRRRRAAAAKPNEEWLSSGLTERKVPRLSPLGRRADHGLSGAIVDAGSGAALPHASLVARVDKIARAVPVDVDGRFVVEDLPAGTLLVEVAARGYVPERFVRALPHRGELRQVRICLVPLRVRIFDAWRRATARLRTSPQPETVTPRELCRGAAGPTAGPLHALTGLVETAVWGAAPPSLEDLDEAERIAAELKAES